MNDDDLDRQLTGALQGHVRDVEADDALRDRIESSIAARADGRRPNRSAWWLLGAAAVLLVGVLVWQGSSDDDGRGVVAGETETPTTEADPTPTTEPDDTTSTSQPPPIASSLPDRAVVAFTEPEAATAELVLVDLTTGERLGTIDSVDNQDCEEISACYVTYASTAVSAFGDLFVETCCEPAGGDVPRYRDLDPDTGEVSEREPFLGGYEPTVDPRGRRIATAGMTSIEIRDLPDGASHSIALADDAGTVFPTGLVWSPDGTRLAVSLGGDDGNRLVVVAADATSLDDGEVVAEWPERRAVQAWTADGRLWLLHADDASEAFPISTLDPDSGATSSYEVLAREIVADRTGRFLYVVTTDGLHRADHRATDADGLLGALLVPSDGRTIGAVSVFASIDCAAEGEPLVTVPSVIGRALPDAIEAVEAVGLRVVGTGTPPGDSTGADAEVTAQEPPAGSEVPAGACIGFRTG